MNRFKKVFLIFLVGFFIYIGMEVMWGGLIRPSGHKSFIGLICMGVLGGILLNILGGINEFCPLKKLPMVIQCLIGAVLISVIEFVAGCILNIGLGLNIWDYSYLALNIEGQVSLLYTLIWFILCPFYFWLDDELKWIFYKVEGRDTHIDYLWVYYKRLIMFQ